MPERARRVKQRIGKVLYWAKVAGYRSGDNPASCVTLALPNQNDEVKHHEAMDFAEVPAFIKFLRQCSADVITRLSFEYLILTAARSGEVRFATWPEIDFENAKWSIPGARTKTGKDHDIPLSAQCLEILRRAKEISPDSELIFPSPQTGKALSDNTLAKLLKSNGYTCKPHGFRSTFKDWISERTNFPNEVSEMALGHTIRSKVERAYRRRNLFEKRRKLMDAWATYATTDRDCGKVVPLRGTA